MPLWTWAKSGELTVKANVQRQMSIIRLTRLFPRPVGVIFISFPFPSFFFFYVRTTCRQISKAEGSSLAHFYNAAFFETSAAEEYNCVERVFHEAIRGASLKTLASALLFIFALSLAIVCWFHFFLFFSRRSSPGARTVYADTKFVHCQQRRL